ncbi:DUF6114 domain-containing protein [Streptomyces beijiangensis]|uniref:Integral membrane protein n=1 Tax=Streptomyces beijiangensis TaxID=163361 RepID=A0A939F9C8_9ACTN|nr:DUF6114 domain-containing protein [Streptomyces beijiangensis]MBO0514136.1 hypothetical protein [Streptomyces beijiangensis]
MSAESSGDRDFTYWRLRFQAWRGGRPFWAGLFTLLSGGPIIYFPYFNLHLGHLTMAMSTTAGAGSLIIGILLITLGLTMWFHSIVRVFAGIATILLGLISIPLSNIGGFLAGFLLALFGGTLSIAWAPGKASAEPAEPHAQGPVGAEPERAPLLGEFDHAAVPEQQQAAQQQQVPQQPPAVHDDTTFDANGGRHRAG